MAYHEFYSTSAEEDAVIVTDEMMAAAKCVFDGFDQREATSEDYTDLFKVVYQAMRLVELNGI